MAVDEIAASLLHQVTTIAGQVTGRMQEGLERLDLTGPTANLLWVLNPEDDPQSLRRLATLLHCDPSNISLLSAQLEERGLAERHPHPRDRRVRTLVLTPEAGRFVSACLPSSRSVPPSLILTARSSGSCSPCWPRRSTVRSEGGHRHLIILEKLM